MTELNVEKAFYPIYRKDPLNHHEQKLYKCKGSELLSKLGEHDYTVVCRQDEFGNKKSFKFGTSPKYNYSLHYSGQASGWDDSNSPNDHLDYNLGNYKDVVFIKADTDPGFQINIPIKVDVTFSSVGGAVTLNGEYKLVNSSNVIDWDTTGKSGWWALELEGINLPIWTARASTSKFEIASDISYELITPDDIVVPCTFINEYNEKNTYKVDGKRFRKISKNIDPLEKVSDPVIGTDRPGQLYVNTNMSVKGGEEPYTYKNEWYVGNTLQGTGDTITLPDNPPDSILYELIQTATDNFGDFVTGNTSYQFYPQPDGDYGHTERIIMGNMYTRDGINQFEQQINGDPWHQAEFEISGMGMYHPEPTDIIIIEEPNKSGNMYDEVEYNDNFNILFNKSLELIDAIIHIVQTDPYNEFESSGGHRFDVDEVYQAKSLLTDQRAVIFKSRPPLMNLDFYDPWGAPTFPEFNDFNNLYPGEFYSRIHYMDY